MPKYVYRFSEGDKDQKDLLGGKGANLAEMTRLDLPVPPGFTITTDACRAYLASGEVPEELSVQVTTALRGVEEELGRELGAAEDPLLVSVRSGAKFSMPGMMETVLNIGLNDVSVKGLAAASSAISSTLSAIIGDAPMASRPLAEKLAATMLVMLCTSGLRART